MRIALANSSRIWGGAEVMTEVFARGFRARGHDVVILCRRGAAVLERLGGEFPCEPVLGGFDLNPRAVAGSALALRRHRSEVLMTMTQKDPRTAGPAARLVGVPLVVRHPMDVPFRPEPHHRFYYGWLPAHLIANSHATRRTMLASAPWLAPERVTVIHNGVDVERFAAAAPADLGLPAGAVAVGFVARFEARKGIQDLAAAWPAVAEHVPAAHLVLVGEGGDLEAQMRARLTPPRRAHWLGFRRDIPAVMKALDVLVLPSHNEGFGLVVAEAMAAGTPVVASRASNLPELLDDGVEGRLFEVGNAESLAAALAAVAGDAAARERMGRAGEARVRRQFSVGRMLERYEAVLGAVAAGAPIPA